MTTFYEIASIPAIAAIVYTIIDIVKTAVGGTEKFKRFIPLISCALGACREFSRHRTFSLPLY